ncbi:hypothetical protein F4778DRAFT_201446 [Xylariomycetidae sp. FL2044]|nr:hypothetical protein F4778DRAFT_201446 [Xylariomycetidae sp. FL2044]
MKAPYKPLNNLGTAGGKPNSGVYSIGLYHPKLWKRRSSSWLHLRIASHRQHTGLIMLPTLSRYLHSDPGEQTRTIEAINLGAAPSFAIPSHSPTPSSSNSESNLGIPSIPDCVAQKQVTAMSAGSESSESTEQASELALPEYPRKYAYRPMFGAVDHVALISCVWCNKTAKLQCPTCHSWYCGHECYRDDWKEHKILCQLLKDGQDFCDARRPENAVRGIVFPAHSPIPTFIWLDAAHVDRSICFQFGMHPENDRDAQRLLSGLSADINGLIGWRDIGHGVRHTPASQKRSSYLEINQSIMKLAKPGHSRVCYGPVIYSSYKMGDDKKMVFEDTTLRDFRCILDFERNSIFPCLSEFMRNPRLHTFRGVMPHISLSESPYFLRTSWQAVKINCDGDLQRFAPFWPDEKPLFIESVRVLEGDPQQELKLAPRFTPLLPSLLNLPWLIEYCDLTNRDLDREERFNPELRWLTEHPTSSDHDLEHFGTVILMHRGGKPLHRAHVLGFLNFARIYYYKRPKGRGDCSLEPNEEDSEFYKNFFSENNFRGYWRQWITDMAAEREIDIDGIKVLSPYDD